MRLPQNRVSLAIVCLTLASIPALAAFVLRPVTPPPPQNGTITFHVHTSTPGGTASGMLNQTTTVVLAVAKAGKTPLVAGQPSGGQVDGTYSFANGTTGGAIAQYYGDLLTGSGWVPGVDFVRCENSLHFYGIGAISVDADHRQLYTGLAVVPH